MSDYWICLWVSDVSLSMESWYLVFQLVYSLFEIVVVSTFFWMSEREIFICEFQICPLKRDKFEFQHPSATLYLLLQSVADSMAVAVAFPDFSGFLAFRAPNIWLPKSGSNGSFLELIFLVLTWLRGICLLVHKVLSTTLGSDPVRRIWLCPWFRSTSWFWIPVLFLTLTSSR